jgi:hypothetical protein
VGVFVSVYGCIFIWILSEWLCGFVKEWIYVHTCVNAHACICMCVGESVRRCVKGCGYRCGMTWERCRTCVCLSVGTYPHTRVPAPVYLHTHTLTHTRTTTLPSHPTPISTPFHTSTHRLTDTHAYTRMRVYARMHVYPLLHEPTQPLT